MLADSNSVDPCCGMANEKPIIRPPACCIRSFVRCGGTVQSFGGRNEPIIRPRVADLVFRLYDRTLHPELFETLSLRRIKRDRYTLTARMTPTGHALEWTNGEDCLFEVTTTSGEVLPEQGLRLQHRFEGTRSGRWELGPTTQYKMSLQAEILPPEVYLHVHEELARDGAKRGLIFHYPSHNRLGLAPMGYITVETLPTGLSVSAFHTFPEEFTVVKTQSLIEFS